MDMDIHRGFLHTDGEFIKFGGDPGDLILLPFIVQELSDTIDIITAILVTEGQQGHITIISSTEKRPITRNKKIKRALTIIKTNSKQKIKTRQRTISKLRISNRQRIKIKQQPSNKLIRIIIQRVHKTSKSLVEVRRGKDNYGA